MGLAPTRWIRDTTVSTPDSDCLGSEYPGPSPVGRLRIPADPTSQRTKSSTRRASASGGQSRTHKLGLRLRRSSLPGPAPSLAITESSSQIHPRCRQRCGPPCTIVRSDQLSVQPSWQPEEGPQRASSALPRFEPCLAGATPCRPPARSIRPQGRFAASMPGMPRGPSGRVPVRWPTPDPILAQSPLVGGFPGGPAHHR